MTVIHVFDPGEWIAMHRALPEELRERKAKVMVAAFAEVGIKTESHTIGGTWASQLPPIGDPLGYRAHEIGCRSIGLEPLPFEQWAIVDEYLYQHLVAA